MVRKEEMATPELAPELTPELTSELTQEPYTLAGITFSPFSSLMGIDGKRYTYTPSVAPDKDELKSIQKLSTRRRICIPDSLRTLISHLLPKGGRILDLCAKYGDITVATKKMKGFSYTGVGSIPDENVVASIDEVSKDPYDMVIINLGDPVPKSYVSKTGVVLVRGDETSVNTYEKCWLMEMPYIFGMVGVRNMDGTCDPFFISGKEKITLPEPTPTTLPFVQSIKIPKTSDKYSSFISFESYKGSKIPYLGSDVALKLRRYFDSVGIIQKHGVISPTDYIFHLHNVNNLHLFLYDSDNPNRSYVLWNEDDKCIYVHNCESEDAAKSMRDKFVLSSVEEYVKEHAYIIREMMDKYEYKIQSIEVRGSNDLFARCVCGAYPESKIHIRMKDCRPETLSYIQSGRKSLITYTSEMSKKPSLIAESNVIRVIPEVYKDTESVSRKNLPYLREKGTSPGMSAVSPKSS